MDLIIGRIVGWQPGKLEPQDSGGCSSDRKWQNYPKNIQRKLRWNSTKVYLKYISNSCTKGLIIFRFNIGAQEVIHLSNTEFLMPGTFGEKKIFEILSSSCPGLFQVTSTREVQHSILNLFLDKNHTLGLTLSTHNFAFLIPTLLIEISCKVRGASFIAFT